MLLLYLGWLRPRVIFLCPFQQPFQTLLTTMKNLPPRLCKHSDEMSHPLPVNPGTESISLPPSAMTLRLENPLVILRSLPNLCLPILLNPSLNPHPSLALPMHVPSTPLLGLNHTLLTLNLFPTFPTPALWPFLAEPIMGINPLIQEVVDRLMRQAMVTQHILQP